MREFNSAEEYAQAMIDDIIALEETIPVNEQLPLTLLKYWSEEIKIYAEECWNDYIVGKREHYMFDEEEFRKVYDKAGIRYTSEVIDGLIDDGYVQMGIRDDGEIVYSATDKGRQAINERKQNKNE